MRLSVYGGWTGERAKDRREIGDVYVAPVPALHLAHSPPILVLVVPCRAALRGGREGISVCLGLLRAEFFCCLAIAVKVPQLR